MPDLRGSITSDKRRTPDPCPLEAVCPPDAKRPHHQDAYLVSQFPEPPGAVAKLSGAGAVQKDFLIPPLSEDNFGQRLCNEITTIVASLASRITA